MDKDTITLDKQSSLFEEETIIKNKHTSLLDNLNFNIAIVGVFSSLTVVGGFLLAVVPNFELFSLMIFLSGFLFGKKSGLLITTISVIIFAFLNPMGASHIFLFGAQIISYLTLCLSGIIINTFLKEKEYYKPAEDLYIFQVLLIFGGIGFVWTIFSDIFLTLGMYIPLVGIASEIIVPILLAGIPFTIIHVISNTLLFIFVLPALIQICLKVIKLH